MLSLFNLSSLLSRGLIIHIFAYFVLILYISLLKNNISDLHAETSKLKADLALEKKNTENAFLIIENQNSKIEQIKIDSKKLSLKNDNLTQKLNERFKNIKTPLKNDCCDKLKFYDSLILEFNNDYSTQ